MGRVGVAITAYLMFRRPVFSASSKAYLFVNAALPDSTGALDQAKPPP